LPFFAIFVRDSSRTIDPLPPFHNQHEKEVYMCSMRSLANADPSIKVVGHCHEAWMKSFNKDEIEGALEDYKPGSLKDNHDCDGLLLILQDSESKTYDTSFGIFSYDESGRRQIKSWREFPSDNINGVMTEIF